MSATEQEYKNHIKELEQQVRLLKEQVDFLTRKLYGTKSEKTSTLEIEGQMSLFNEIETCADPDAHEPELVEIEKHLRKRKYTGQREELVKNLPHSKVLHTIDEREQICDNCGSTMVKVGEEFVRTEVQFIPAKLKVIDHYRETYECRSCRKNGTPYMEKAPVPYPPVLHSLASASTITWLIHQKFELSIPLYRQEKEWEDAYSGYNAVSGVKRCLCYTHLRRAFVDALPKDIHNSEASKPAEAILRLNQLFNIESELEAFPPDQKKKERLIREKPLLEAFWSWAEKSAIGELPKSKLSKAFHYALNNREGFWNYLEDGNCSISNSLAENCIRPFVIGRKNWLFSGSPKGAEASAGIYTLVETAKANGLAPMKYIKYILSDMPGSAFLEHPEYLDDYLPWNPLVKEFCR